MNKIKVLLAEDHTIVRKGLCSLLDKEMSIEVVWEKDFGLRNAECGISLDLEITHLVC